MNKKTTLIAIVSLCFVLTKEVFPGSVTSAGFGHRVTVPGMTNNSVLYGDTWDAAWSYNDSLYIQMNDGTGASSGYVHDRLCLLKGTPEDRQSLSVVDLNPGTLGNGLNGPCYSTGTYEVDSILYHIISYSTQGPLWIWHHTNILKSTDGGRNWLNHQGNTNAFPADDSASSMFPEGAWGHLNFVKYGQGGEAPNVDNAKTFIYLTAQGEKLARIRRVDLPLLDKTKYQYYKGGDGLVDSAWSNNKSDAIAIHTNPISPTAMVYNEGLQRYVMTSFRSNSWSDPPVLSTLRVMESPHPWGPWTQVLDENVNSKEGDNLTWSYIIPKFTHTDGKVMWMSVSGRNPYSLQFMPIFLSTSDETTLEAEAASFSGVTVATAKAGFSGAGYLTGFDALNDQCRFTLNAESSGVYIVKLRYNTSSDQTIGFYINDSLPVALKVGTAEQVYATWTDLSLFVWLNAGANSLSIKFDAVSSGAVNIDKIAYSFYSSTQGIVPLTPTPQTAFGTPAAIPGTIEAENFDEGGEGVAYHDGDPIDHGTTQYRNTSVDLEPCSDGGSGYAVDWTQESEWLEYTVDATAGNYDITARTASASGTNMHFLLLLNGDTLCSFPLTTTGGWGVYQSFTVSGVEVKTTGRAVLRLAIIGGSFNLNRLIFTPAPSTKLEGFSTVLPTLSVHPNPFSSGGVIAFTLREPARAELSIFDCSGQQVKRVAFSTLRAGKHTMRWDGTNNRGEKLASGVYYLRLMGSQLRMDRKFIYLR